LLNEEAISFFLKHFDKEVSPYVIRDLILECLETEKNNKKFFPQGLLTGNLMDDVKASTVLDRIVKTYISPDYSYSKPKHGAILVKWILEQNPEIFNNLVELLEGFISNTK
jgi:hypothetical protein